MARGSHLNLKLDLESVKRKPPDKNIQPTAGLLEFSDGSRFTFTSQDLEVQECIGTGSYGGIVSKMIHRTSGKVMVVKRVRAKEIDNEQRQLMLRELDMIISSQPCEDIVRFYGALFQDLIRALSYLKEKLQIIHRGKDVKPSNVLLDRRGFVKLCDFGISGYLIDSIAKTQDVGCRIYLAPERLSNEPYDIRSDVWSLGITLIEICIGRFPYSDWSNVFEQIQAVVCDDPPLINVNDSYYSIELVNFVNRCIIKEKRQRPKYAELATDPFIRRHNHTADPERMHAERDVLGAYIARFSPAT